MKKIKYNKNRNYQINCKTITSFILNKISSRFTLLQFSFRPFIFKFKSARQMSIQIVVTGTKKINFFII